MKLLGTEYIYLAIALLELTILTKQATNPDISAWNHLLGTMIIGMHL